MLPTISVIIPVYNVEKFLARCIDSVLNQTFQDFEIILVNDGSTDKSGIICDEYAQKDQRISVIHKKNARVSAARNDGIRMAKGKYISFIDSDDWIEPEMYQEMVNKAEEFNLDIVMCDYKKCAENYEQCLTQPIRGGLYTKQNIKDELYKCLIMFDHLEFPPTISNCVCLLNSHFIKENNLFYDEDIHYCEDSLFGSKAMYHAKNFYYLKNHHYYYYFYNPNSTTNTYSEKKWNSYLRINQRLIEYFGNITEYDFSRQIKVNMLYFTLNTLGQIPHKNPEDNIKRITEIMVHPKVIDLFKGFRMPQVSLKTKIVLLLIKYKMVRLYNVLVISRNSSKNMI